MDKPEPSSAVDSELLEQAARLGIDVGGMSESQLRLFLQKLDPAGAEDRARHWAEQNAEAIRDYNERIRRRGSFGDQFRRW